jgi:hypothetical protein
VTETEDWAASLADLAEPPEGIDTAKVGDRIELVDREDDELVILGLHEVIAEWTRGEP